MDVYVVVHWQYLHVVGVSARLQGAEELRADYLRLFNEGRATAEKIGNPHVTIVNKDLLHED